MTSKTTTSPNEASSKTGGDSPKEEKKTENPIQTMKEPMISNKEGTPEDEDLASTPIASPQQTSEEPKPLHTPSPIVPTTKLVFTLHKAERI